MQVSTGTKAIVASIAVALALAFLVIVDLGIYAGRIHRGVGIEGGVAVGGLTLAEAVDKLEEIGDALESQPLVFTAPGFDCRFAPEELGWTAKPFTTARTAMKVGRESAPFGALADRFRAYFGGITVEWADQPSTRKVGKFVQSCEKLGTRFGVEVDKPRLRFRVKRAIVEWPREQLHEIPIVGGSQT